MLFKKLSLTLFKYVSPCVVVLFYTIPQIKFKNRLTGEFFMRLAKKLIQALGAQGIIEVKMKNFKETCQKSKHIGEID